MIASPHPFHARLSQCQTTEPHGNVFGLVYMISALHVENVGGDMFSRGCETVIRVLERALLIRHDTCTYVEDTKRIIIPRSALIIVG